MTSVNTDEIFVLILRLLESDPRLASAFQAMRAGVNRFEVVLGPLKTAPATRSTPMDQKVAESTPNRTIFQGLEDTLPKPGF